jgi:hypothetical protein
MVLFLPRDRSAIRALQLQNAELRFQFGPADLDHRAVIAFSAGLLDVRFFRFFHYDGNSGSFSDMDRFTPILI